MTKKAPLPNKSGLLEGGFLSRSFFALPKIAFLDVSEECNFFVFFRQIFSRDDFCFIATKQYLNKSKNTQNLVNWCLLLEKFRACGALNEWKYSFCFENLEQYSKKPAAGAKNFGLFNIWNVIFKGFSTKYDVKSWKFSASGGSFLTKKTLRKISD